MKMIKLLLIGLLSVVAFVACDETVDTPAAAYSIVQVSDNGTPVLYDNLTVTLKALKDGKYLETVTFALATEALAATTFTTKVGSATIKVLDPAKATGTITASLKTGTGDNTTYDNITYTIVPAKVIGTDLKIDNGTAVVLDDTKKSATLIATAKFGAKIVDVTADTTFVVKAALTTLTAAANVITASDTFTVEVDAVKATFAALNADVSVTSTVTGGGTVTPVLASFTIVPTAVTLTTIDTPITFTITPVVQAGATATADMSDASKYTCAMTAGSVVYASGTGTSGSCDTLETGALGTKGGTVVTVTYTATPGATNTSAPFTITTTVPDAL